ncbi:MAG TPA: DMT family transporter, partial [Victivallales bacterium]|nr:DMT family transporter [Victivallales bacterium]
IGLQPLMVPFLAHWIIQERINKWEIFGLILAFLGTLWLSIRQIELAPSQFYGSAVALFSAFLCGSYIVFGRRYRKDKNAFVFSTGVFAIAALVQGIFSIILHGKISVGDIRTIVSLCCLIVFPTIGGHALMMFLLRYAKSQLMALTVPAQFILATLVSYPIFAEKPQLWFYPGAIMIMTGIVIAVWKADSGDEK